MQNLILSLCRRSWIRLAPSHPIPVNSFTRLSTRGTTSTTAPATASAWRPCVQIRRWRNLIIRLLRGAAVPVKPILIWCLASIVRTTTTLSWRTATAAPSSPRVSSAIVMTTGKNCHSSATLAIHTTSCHVPISSQRRRCLCIHQLHL